MLQIIKGPGDKTDWYLDRAEWLAEVGDDAIDVSDWSIVTGDAELILSAPFSNETMVGTWLEGGTLGADYWLRNLVTTTGGRQDERFVRVSIIKKDK